MMQNIQVMLVSAAYGSMEKALHEAEAPAPPVTRYVSISMSGRQVTQTAMHLFQVQITFHGGRY